MKILFVISTIVIALIFSFLGKGEKIDCEHLMQISTSLEASMERKVFVSRLVPTKNPLIVNDTIQLTFKEIWLERVYSMNCWGYIENRFGQHGEPYQIVAITDSITQNKTKFSINWVIGSNQFNYWRSCGFNAITTYIDSIPNDT